AALVPQTYPQFDASTRRWRSASAAAQRDAAPRGVALDAQPDALLLVELSGRVNATQRNAYRAITAQVQAFAAALVGEGYELVRTQLPFDVTSEGVLSGDIGGAADTGESPRFTVVLGRKLP